MAADENESAKTIQRWWRNQQRDRNEAIDKAIEIIKWNGLTEIQQFNKQQLEKLQQLRREKEKQINRYEFLLSLPARDVNQYLAQASLHCAEDDDEKLLSKHEAYKRNKAAVIIQRFFRRIHHQKIIERYLSSTTKFKPYKRIQLLEKIDESLSRRNHKTGRWPLEDIKTALEQHKKRRFQQAEAFARRQQLIYSINKDIKCLSTLNPSEACKEDLYRLHKVPPFLEYLAKREHLQTMEDLEDEILVAQNFD